MKCTWPGRALHTAELPGGRLPFHIHTHMHLCSSYPDAATKIYWYLLKSWTDCHPTYTSSPWELLQLVYRYLEKCVNIGWMNTKQGECVLVAFTFPLSTLYVSTFSDLNYWDHNQGMIDRSVASRDYRIPWNNINWSPTPNHLPRPPVVVMQLHIIIHRKAVYTCLSYDYTQQLTMDLEKLTHSPTTWFSALSGSLHVFYAYLHKDEVPWVKTDSL